VYNSEETGKNDPHIVFGRDGEVLFCCDDCLIFFGFDSQQEFVEGFHMTQPTYQPDQAKTANILNNVIKEVAIGNSRDFELVMSTNEGRIFQGYLELFRLSEEFVVCFIREKYARVATDTCNLTLIEHAPGVVFLIDENLSIVYCNQHSLKVFGATSQGDFASKFFSRFSKKFQNNMTAATFMNLQVQKALGEGSARFLWYTRRNYGDVATSVRLVRTEFRGMPCCIAYLAEFETDSEVYFEGDISRNFLSDVTWPIVETMPFAWKLLDAELNCIECNEAMVHLMGADNKDYFLANYKEIYQNEEGYEANKYIMKEILENSSIDVIDRFNMELTKFDGTNIPVRVASSPVIVKGRDVFSVFMRDLTKEKAAAEQRELEKERLEAISENAPVGIQIWNYYNEIVFSNEKMAHILGFSNGEEYKQKLDTVSPEFQPDGRPTSETAFDIVMNVAKTGEPTTFDWTLLSKTGEPVPLQRRFLRINYGGEYCLMEFCQDLRPQKEKENALIYEAENVRTLFNAMPLVFELWNEDKELVAANDFALNFFGFYNFQDYFNNFWHLIPDTQPCGGKSAELFASNMENAFDEGKKDVNWMRQSLDGTPVPTRLTMTRMEFEGKPRIICVYQDMRIQIAKEEIIVRESERFKVFFNTVDAACTLWDDQKRLVMCNPAAADFYGLEDIEDFTAVFDRLSPPFQPCGTCSDKKAFGYVEQALEKGSVTFGWEHCKLDGTPLPSRVTLTTTEYQGKLGVFGVVRDLRELMNAESRYKLEIGRLNAILDHVPMAIQIWSRDLELLFVNGVLPNLLGFEDESEYRRKGSTFFAEAQEYGITSAEYDMELLNKAFEDGFVRAEGIHKATDGTLVPMDCTMINIDYGGTDAVLEFCRDLRESYALDEERRQNRQRINAILNSSPIASFILEKSGHVLLANVRAATLFGLDRRHKLAENLHKFFPKTQPDGILSAERWAAKVDQAYSTLGDVDFEWTWQGEGSDVVPCHITLHNVELDGDDALIVHMQDLRQIRSATEAVDSLQKMVHTDALTEVFSRRYFDENASKKLQESVERGKPFTVMMVDIDNFKMVNDTYGHQVGDEVLKILSIRMSRAIRANGFIARYGGEEFVVLMPDVGLEDASKIACRIRKSIVENPFTVGDLRLPITISVGVADRNDQTPTLPQDLEEGVKHILNRADMAMYAAKSQGKNRVMYCHDGDSHHFDCGCDD